MFDVPWGLHLKVYLFDLSCFYMATDTCSGEGKACCSRQWRITFIRLVLLSWTLSHFCCWTLWKKKVAYCLAMARCCNAEVPPFPDHKATFEDTFLNRQPLKSDAPKRNEGCLQNLSPLESHYVQTEYPTIIRYIMVAYDNILRWTF